MLKKLLSDKLALPAAIAWLGAIWLVSSLPLQQHHRIQVFGWDKLLHLLEYLILALLVNRSLITLKSKRGTVILVYILLALSAILDEWHQRFIPNRSVAVWDLLANLFGLGLGGLSFWKQGDRSKEPQPQA